jgi:hypothetical protein
MDAQTTLHPDNPQAALRLDGPCHRRDLGHVAAPAAYRGQTGGGAP